MGHSVAPQTIAAAAAAVPLLRLRAARLVAGSPVAGFAVDTFGATQTVAVATAAVEIEYSSSAVVGYQVAAAWDAAQDACDHSTCHSAAAALAVDIAAAAATKANSSAHATAARQIAQAWLVLPDAPCRAQVHRLAGLSDDTAAPCQATAPQQWAAWGAAAAGPRAFDMETATGHLSGVGQTGGISLVQAAASVGPFQPKWTTLWVVGSVDRPPDDSADRAGWPHS